MSRRKVVNTYLEDKYRLKKKRQRIYRTVNAIYAVLLASLLLIGGIMQHNGIALGVALIIMGAISIPFALFNVYMHDNGWAPVFYYDIPENAKYASKEGSEDDLRKHDQLLTYIILVTGIGGIILPILGVLKIFGVI